MCKRILIITITLCALIITFSGCGEEKSINSANVPVIQECSLKGICEGGENDQYVIADMQFDRKISYDDKLIKQLRVVIGEQRVKDENITVSKTEDDCIQLKIAVNQVNDGVIEITNAPNCSKLTSLTDESGKYCVESINIKKVIPSGAVISCISSGKEEAVYRVDSTVTHRSIIWLRLYDGETIVEPADTNTTDVLENAIAVHQHDFLWATPETTASDIAESINSFYESYEAYADGNELTVRRKASQSSSDEESSIELKIYEG